MNKRIFSSALIVLLLASSSAFGDTRWYSQCAQIESETEWLDFINHESQSNPHFVKQALNFHALREKRDLPNTMARKSSSDEIKSDVDHAIEDLRHINRKARHKILSCMAFQNYDESLSRTGIEALLRLPDNAIQRWLNVLSGQKKENMRALVEEISANISAKSF